MLQPVEEYRFGYMKIGGKQYRHDLIILPDGSIIDNWWRKEGHRLGLDDITEILRAKPEILVVGTGFYGVMEVSSEVKKALAERRVELIIQDTRKAVETYNKTISSESRRRIAAAFHLTC